MHPGTLLRKARQGRIGCFREGSKVLFSDAHIEAYIAAHSQDAVPLQKAARVSRKGRPTA